MIPSNFTVGFKMAEVQLYTKVNDGKYFGGSIYQKVNKKSISPDLQEIMTLPFGLAVKYQVDSDACFLAKVNNSSLMGFEYTLKP